MIAYLFAAGRGERMGKLSTWTQKCLLPVGGKPMLEWWLDAVFESKEFVKVYVNVHHKAEQVEKFLKWYGNGTGRRVRIIDEREGLLGTAGTLYVHGERASDFMSAYTDTFSWKLLSDMAYFARLWKSQNGDAAGGLVGFVPPDDGSASAIETDALGRVTMFSEKCDGGSVAWAGVLFGKGSLLSMFDPDETDLARETLPRLKRHLRVISMVDAYDIGRGPDYYERFKRDFSSKVALQ